MVNAVIHHDIEGEIRTVTVSRNPDGRYFASILVKDDKEELESSTDGNAIGIDLGLTDFAVTSNGSNINILELQKNTKKI